MTDSENHHRKIIEGCRVQTDLQTEPGIPKGLPGLYFLKHIFLQRVRDMKEYSGANRMYSRSVRKAAGRLHFLTLVCTMNLETTYLS